MALYQSFVQWGFNSGLGGCVGLLGECAKVYVKAFDYITIPFMSFTIFVYSVGLILIYYQARKVYGE